MMFIISGCGGTAAAGTRDRAGLSLQASHVKGDNSVNFQHGVSRIVFLDAITTCFRHQPIVPYSTS